MKFRGHTIKNYQDMFSKIFDLKNRPLQTFTINKSFPSGYSSSPWYEQHVKKISIFRWSYESARLSQEATNLPYIWSRSKIIMTSLGKS